jgi:hypothetical protein
MGTSIKTIKKRILKMKLNYLHSSSDIIFDAGIGGT